jgi:hypothetical protein
MVLNIRRVRDNRGYFYSLPMIQDFCEFGQLQAYHLHPVIRFWKMGLIDSSDAAHLIVMALSYDPDLV